MSLAANPGTATFYVGNNPGVKLMLNWRNLIYMLSVQLVLICVVGNMAFARAESAIEATFDKRGIKLESGFPDHSESLWRVFNESLSKDLELGVSVSFFAGAYLNLDADIVELNLHDAISACARGEINLLPYHQILPDNMDLADYVWNGLQPCAVGHSVWADLITYDSTLFLNKPEPVSFEDFFNIEDFPGKRAIKKTPRALAEWSLMLDGVRRQDVYSALTGDDAWSQVEIALELLDQQILWVDHDHEALELLDQGHASFALVSSQNLVRRIEERKKYELPYNHYEVIWSEAIAHMNMLAVPKKRQLPVQSGPQEKTLEFLRYVMDPYRNLQLSTTLGYAPVSRLHTGFIDETYRAVIPIDTQLDSLFWSNDKWWREAGYEIEVKFRQYLARSYLLKVAEF